MSISDAQYAAWLKADGQSRALLVEAVAYSGGSAVTRYFSNKAYVSGPADTPANIAYDDILIDVPSINLQMSEQFSGNAAGSWGDIVISNEGGARDSWLTDAWDGRAIELLMGDVSWARDDFRTVMRGVSADIVASDNGRLTLRIRDHTWATNVPIQTNLIGGTTANANRLKPLCFGQCFNVEPVLVTAATHEYQVHDGPIEDITDVRDNGVTVAYTKDLTNGKFTLSAAPAGRITADVKGYKPTEGYLVKCADIAVKIITDRTQLVSGDIDGTNFTAFQTTAPQTLGLYITQFMTVAAALDELLRAVGGFWTWSRAGLLQLGLLIEPSGTPALEIGADDVLFRSLKMERRIVPVLNYRLGYKRNWTPQADGLAGAVTEANRALYAAPEQAVTQDNAGVDTTYLLARSPDAVSTLLVDSTEAQTECDRRATLWGDLRGIYNVTCFAAPFTLQLGDVIELTHPRYGFSGGELAVVIGIKEMPTRGRIDLRLFK